MPAYIVVQGSVTDPVGFADYVRAVTPLVERMGGRYLAVGGRPSVVEGDWGYEALVVHEWPDRTAAERFWHSSEYAEVRKLRSGRGEFLVLIVDGAAPQQEDKHVTAG
ncbi:MAG: DUF1330 domain-containing protein [Gammaproteobacteria bacterium AqS3]|nr:DUF1330 domain-containing protein [Gammaproteobacteria bacterium AqS3]